MLKFAVSRLTENYNHYYTTRTYQSRYPKANQHTLSMIRRHLDLVSKGAYVLDYGCGDGRYLLPLSRQYPDLRFIGHDISPVSLQLLGSQLNQDEQLGVTLTNTVQQLDDALKSCQMVSMALLLFGVLSHIKSARERQQVLVKLRQSLTKTKGCLIVSVPNKKRRFRCVQRKQGSHGITYSRIIGGVKTAFYYHLYDVDTIQQELYQAGFSIENQLPESILPESWVTRFPWLGWLDHRLCQFLPANWGYGIITYCKVR